MKKWLYIIWALFVGPCLFYFLGFVLFTWPQIQLFSSHFLTDGGDGLQMVWNVWWVNKAVTELHTNPWYTTYLHAPHGISLLAHTLHPLKGFLSIPLLTVFTLKQAYNTALISSFVLSGLTAYWLARFLKIGYIGSLLAGFIYTFSNYHFTHAQGHMQLVAMEWIPLYILCLIAWLQKPKMLYAIGMAGSLFLVILCDYYYFFFCVLSTGIAVIWQMVKTRRFFFLTKSYIKTGLVFVLVALPTSGLVAGALTYLSATDPLSGVHLAREFPMDPFSLVIPGGHWRFNEWTRFFWSRLPGNINESSVYLGLAVCAFLVLSIIYRKHLNKTCLSLFWSLFIFFVVIACGQRLNVFGYELKWLPMPYVALEFIIPPFRISGVPVRMVTVAILSAGIISGMTVQYLIAQSRSWKWILSMLMGVMVFEFIPTPLPATEGLYPPYVEILKDAPEGLIYDPVTYHTHALYYQTIHEKPVAYGYVSRQPLSTRKKDQVFRVLFEQHHDVNRLYQDYGFRYFVVKPDAPFGEWAPQAKLLYKGDSVALYDMQVVVP